MPTLYASPTLGIVDSIVQNSFESLAKSHGLVLPSSVPQGSQVKANSNMKRIVSSHIKAGQGEDRPKRRTRNMV